MTDGFSVDRAALRETAQGIDNTIGALKGWDLMRKPTPGAGFRDLNCRGCKLATEGFSRHSVVSASAGRGACGRWCRTGTRSRRGWGSLPGCMPTPRTT